MEGGGQDTVFIRDILKLYFATYYTPWGHFLNKLKISLSDSKVASSCAKFDENIANYFKIKL